jgi:predicted acetyltransferase
VSGETLRHATETDIGKIVGLLMRIFGTGGRWTPEAFHTFYEGDSSYAPEQSLLIECDGAIASHVRCSRRMMRVGEALVDLGAVSSVATLPEYRGRGYASALMQAAVDYMCRRGDQVSMLFTSIQPFYERLGWVTYPRYWVQKKLTGNRAKLTRRLSSTTPPEGVSIRPVDRERDQDPCAKLHLGGNARLSLCLVRPEAWWRDKYAWSWDRETDRFLVAEREGGLGAYLRAMAWRSEVAVMDAAPADGEEQALTAMLHQVVGCCPDARTVSGPVPPGTPLDRAIRNLPGETQEWESNDMMLRLMDVRELLRRLLPAMDLRCASLPPRARRGEIAVSTPGGSLALRVTNGVQVVEPTADALQLAMTDGEALLLALGYTSVDRLRFARDGVLAKDAAATLSHLFPVRPQVFWAMDHF